MHVIDQWVLFLVVKPLAEGNLPLGLISTRARHTIYREVPARITLTADFIVRGVIVVAGVCCARDEQV